MFYSEAAITLYNKSIQKHFKRRNGMDLQTTFYVIGIIFMSLMTLIILALVIAVFAIKAKINLIHRRIEEKVHSFTEVAQMGEALVHKAQDMANRHKNK